MDSGFRELAVVGCPAMDTWNELEDPSTPETSIPSIGGRRCSWLTVSGSEPFLGPSNGVVHAPCIHNQLVFRGQSHL